MIKKFLNGVIDRWPDLLLFLGSTVIFLSTLLFKLNTLVPGVAPAELNMAESLGLKQTFINPLNAHYKLIALGFSKLFSTVTALRLTSVLFGLLSIWLFYLTIHRWHTRRIAIIGTLLFASSSWFLHSARIGLPLVTYFIPLALLAYGPWFIDIKKFTLAALLGTCLFLVLIHTPGLASLVILAVFWQRKRIFTVLKELSWPWRLIISFFLLVGLAPITYALGHDFSLFRTWIGLPRELSDLYRFVSEIVSVIQGIFVSFLGPPDSWVSGTPLLDIISAVMLIFGAYAYFFKTKLDRTKTVAAAIVVLTLLIALRALHIFALMPYLYILVAGGFALMLQQWLTVFPRNPLARIGVTIMVVAIVMLSVIYQMRRYFVVWPNSPQTKAAFIENKQ